MYKQKPILFGKLIFETVLCGFFVFFDLGENVYILANLNFEQSIGKPCCEKYIIFDIAAIIIIYWTLFKVKYKIIMKFAQTFNLISAAAYLTIS